MKIMLRYYTDRSHIIQRCEGR